MADDHTTTQEDNILADVDNDSTEQRLDDENAESNSDSNKFDNKFMTKTNQRIADSDDFVSYIARGYKPQDIMEENPELAQRLSRNKKFADLFTDEGSEEDLETKIERKVQEKLGATERDRMKNEALRSFTVEGKKLTSEDIRILNDNDKFKKSFNALVDAGHSPEDAMRGSFSLSFPKFAKKVMTSTSI